jgi:hypothetical protein
VEGRILLKCILNEQGEGVNRVYLAQGWVLVNTVINFSDPIKGGEFLDQLRIRFTRRTLPHGVSFANVIISTKLKRSVLSQLQFDKDRGVQPF